MSGVCRGGCRGLRVRPACELGSCNVSRPLPVAGVIAQKHCSQVTLICMPSVVLTLGCEYAVGTVWFNIAPIPSDSR